MSFVATQRLVLLGHGGREPYQTHQRKISQGNNVPVGNIYMAGQQQQQQQQQQVQQVQQQQAVQQQQVQQQVQQQQQIPQPPPQQQQQMWDNVPQPPNTMAAPPPQPPPCNIPPAPPGPPPPPSGPPAPPAPPAPPMNAGPAAPPAPPLPAGGAAPPPAPPPPPPPPAPAPASTALPPKAPPAPPPPGPAAGLGGPGGLAAALRGATLKKVAKPEVDADGNINYAANTGTIGRAGLPGIPGADDMMTEMAKRLRERRAKAEGLQTDTPDGSGGANDKKPWEKTNGNGKPGQNGSESPKVGRNRRFKSLTGQENISLPTANGTAGSLYTGELEQLKQEILTEVRQEVQKAKAEIIEAIKAELNRR